MPVKRFPLRPLMQAALLASALGTGLNAIAQNAGEVEFSRGVGFAQTPGQTPRTLGKGLPLQEGDRLTTSDGASAIIKLQDGTRMTVRPQQRVGATAIPVQRKRRQQQHGHVPAAWRAAGRYGLDFQELAQRRAHPDQYRHHRYSWH